MKKITRIFVFMGMLIALLSTTSCSYNRMVAADEQVNSTWSEVQNQYQRRLDLVPNLVSTVKGYAAHESNTLEAVTFARTKASAINLSADELTDENLAKFQQAQDELGSSLGRLLAIAEAYPDLKANQNFRDLQAQLEGTENRIAVARRNFNTATQDYNTLIRKFPAIITAKIFGFNKKSYFEATTGAENAPQVSFE